MKLWVGLGNPGPKYAGNRHNIGFMAVDRIAADHGFGPWRRAFKGEAAEGRFGAERVLLLKPGTFMNLSGEAVGEALRFHKLTAADVTVFHDELDLAPGKCRWKAGGGHAGHNGLRSIHQHLGTDAYGRIRLGIGHPGHKDAVAAYVLHDFAKADAGWLDDLLRGLADGAPALAAGDPARFMNAVALRTAPPRSSEPPPAAKTPVPPNPPPAPRRGCAQPAGPAGRQVPPLMLRVGVVGAGIGGLAAAALLAQAGHRVTLAERFARPRPVGSGLVVQPVGLAVLDALGAGDDARALGQPIGRMLGHAGRRAVLDVSYRAGTPGLAMHRAALFHVLWQAMERAGVTLAPGAAVTAAPQDGTGRMVLRDGADPLGPFDLVVDAAGAGSPLSPLRARPLGFGAVWGHVPWPAGADLPPDRLSQRYLGAHCMAGVLPIGRLPGDATLRAAVFWSLPRAALDGWAGAPFDEWRDGVNRFWPAMAPFLAALRGPEDMTPARYGHGTLSRPFGPALVHLGDAAHRASPQLGQGANMALLDAMALRLALDGDPVDALPAFARMRRWHVRAYQVMSAVFTPFYQSDSRALPVLRDHALAPLSRLPGMRHLLTALVSGDLIPPLASTRWP